MSKASSSHNKIRMIAAPLLFLLALVIGWSVVWMPLVPQSSRAPASIEDGDIPTYDPDLYANDSLQDLEKEYRRLNAKSRRAARHLEAPRSPSALSAEIFKNVQDARSSDALKLKLEAESRTGIKARRARLVVIQTELFREAALKGRMLLPLFDNASLTFSLQAPSAFGVNHSIYVGQITDDPASRVRITVDGALMNGRIETSSGNYQILSAGGGRHYIIEVDPLSTQR